MSNSLKEGELIPWGSLIKPVDKQTCLNCQTKGELVTRVDAEGVSHIHCGHCHCGYYEEGGNFLRRTLGRILDLPSPKLRIRLSVTRNK